jgi:hypothetical protein
VNAPFSTGQVARLLKCTEPQLNGLIRRGRISAPPVVAGRRAWRAGHIHEAAKALDRPVPNSATMPKEAGS